MGDDADHGRPKGLEGVKGESKGGKENAKQFTSRDNQIMIVLERRRIENARSLATLSTKPY
jgi:hypothetical protein